jgi:hypothetical protein
MRCRPEKVLLILGSGLFLFCVVLILFLWIVPMGIGGWLVSLAAFWWGLPLSLIFLVGAAWWAVIVHLTERK